MIGGLKRRLRDWLGPSPGPEHPSCRPTRSTEEIKVLLANVLLANRGDRSALPGLRHAEFKVFSQFGDDGIIQYLIENVAIRQDSFVEFGVENYTESNTRFLLVNNNWRGLVMDGSPENIEFIRNDDIYWRHDLTAVHAFIDRANINSLLAENGFAGDIGILSIDVDGNDYWIWETISVVVPSIVVVEYNSLFGARRAVTIPYDGKFVRSRAHYSHLYWGCSLSALCRLANEKGYGFVGSNGHGNNAYFVRRDLLGRVPVTTPEEGYVAARFRESRNRDGTLSHLSGVRRLEAIREMPLYDLESATMITVGDLVE